MTDLGKAYMVERKETWMGKIAAERAHLLHKEGCPHLSADAYHASYAKDVETAIAAVQKNLYSSVAPCQHCCDTGILIARKIT